MEKASLIIVDDEKEVLNALHRVLDPLVHFLETLKGIQKVRWNLDIDPIDMS